MTDRTPLTGEWRGETTYLCPFCPYDTLNEEAINDHLRGAHPVPEGADPVDAPGDAPGSPETGETPEPDVEAVAPVEETPAAEPEPDSTPAPDVPVAPAPANTDDDE